MDYYMLNIAFLLIILGVYSITQYSRLSSIKIDRIVSSLLFLGFLCIIALRPTSVRDTDNYIKIFSLMDRYQFTLGLGRVLIWADNLTWMEIGFSNLCKMISLFSNSYQVFFFIIALLTVGVGTFATMIISERTDTVHDSQHRILPALLLFISYYGFLYAGIVLRAGLAISFCLLSYAMIFRKKYLLSVLFYLIALSFHNSVLVFLIVIVIYLIVPAMNIRTYRMLAFIVIGLYFFRFFDIFQKYIISIARFSAGHISFLSFFNSYLGREFLSSGLLKTILLFMFELIFLTFMFSDDLPINQKKNLNVILLVSILAALLGAFPVIVRILDILFIVIIPSQYYALTVASPNQNFSIGRGLYIKKYPICVLGIGLIAVANFLLYSRLAGYLEIYGMR